MLNFPKIPKIALRKFSELSIAPWRSKRDFRVNLTFFWVALHIQNRISVAKKHNNRYIIRAHNHHSPHVSVGLTHGAADSP